MTSGLVTSAQIMKPKFSRRVVFILEPEDRECSNRPVIPAMAVILIFRTDHTTELNGINRMTVRFTNRTPTRPRCPILRVKQSNIENTRTGPAAASRATAESPVTGCLRQQGPPQRVSRRRFGVRLRYLWQGHLVATRVEIRLDFGEYSVANRHLCCCNEKLSCEIERKITIRLKPSHCFQCVPQPGAKPRGVLQDEVCQYISDGPVVELAVDGMWRCHHRTIDQSRRSRSQPVQRCADWPVR